MLPPCNRHPSAIDKHVAARLLRRRQECAIGAEEAAAQLAISRRLLAAYERGERQLSPRHLAAFAEILDVPIAYFFDCFACSERREMRRAIRIGSAKSIHFLPLFVMRERRLVERHAAAAGLGAVSVSYSFVDAGAPLCAGLLAGRYDFLATGTVPFLAAWDATRGGTGIEGLRAISSIPLHLTASNPQVCSVGDFTPDDRINVVLPGYTNQAVLLEMAAARTFGAGEYGRLNPLAVGLPARRSSAALISGTGAVTADFGFPPFSYEQIDAPGVRVLVSAEDLLDGPATYSVLYATSRFCAEDPAITAAVLAAFDEAMALIDRNSREATAIYLRYSRRRWPARIAEMCAEAAAQYPGDPAGVIKFAGFMHDVGRLRSRPHDWRKLFRPEPAASAAGSAALG